MFSMLPTPAHTHLHSHHYTPAVSSPLSSSPLRASPLTPRDTNTLTLTPTREFDPMMSPTPPSKISTPAATGTPSTNPSASTRGGSSRESTFSKRATKPNPLLQKSDTEGRETRRKLFLKKVKEGSEDKRWKTRGGEEEMMRTIWVMEERRRVARLREMGGGEAEDMGESYLSLDEVMLEEVEEEEERELDALISSMGDVDQQPVEEEAMESLVWEQSNSRQDQTETPYGSDDDEYDDIFMDVMREEESLQANRQQPALVEADTDQDMMDMS